MDVCGKSPDIDLSALDLNDWVLRHKTSDNSNIDYNISICSPFNTSIDSVPEDCNNSYICKHNRTDSRAIGFQLKSADIEPQIGSKVKSLNLVFEGPVCEDNPIVNQTVSIRFTCGQHLEYPKLMFDGKCGTHLIWRSYAVCEDQSSVQNEVKCYVFDNGGQRRDLTPLVRPKGTPYKVLSADQEFYINVCSGLSTPCSDNSTGACIGDSKGQFTTVGDYRFSTLQFKGKSSVVPYEHLEMTYRTKSNVCDGNSKTTIRFICPAKHQKRSVEFADRNPKLVSNLDCDYQIEWLTEYACPLSQIETSSTTCELTEEIHGLDFNLKSLLKRNPNSDNVYKIQNISIDTKAKSLFDIEFNVCGGLGDKSCGDMKWNTIAVCLRSQDKSTEDRPIGLTKDGRLRLADNRFVLEYKTGNSKCKFGDNSIAETTIIEFVCDESYGLDITGSPEFVSFEDCNYYIIWRTPLVCPIISANITCLTTYNNWTFDLSVLRKGFGSEPWIAGVSQRLPWSRHSKDKNDTIFMNVCGLLPKTLKTNGCDSRSSVCMTIADTNLTINLGQFMSSPKYNEDIGALELIYEKGFDNRTQKQIKSKFTLRCKRGDLVSEPILIDIDEEQGIYEFEWETSAACPIDAFSGNDCKVYDKYLDFSFDLSPLKAKTPYLLKTDEYDYYINVCGEVTADVCNASAIYNAESPVGACQVEKGGAKRSFSLGKVSTSLMYWNGVINLTQTEGTPYNNAEKTPRKSEIAFICDPNIGNGVPEYDGERDRSYFFRWYTSLACPHAPKVVHCVWDNGSHILDLTQLAMTNGNHVTVGMNSKTGLPAIYYINVCRPLNPIHSQNTDIKDCGPNSAVCRVEVNGQTLSLGEATHPPISAFDGSINLFYENGSPCPTKPDQKIKTRIKFECDPSADLSNPTVYEPGSELTDSEECVYLFDWKTSAVCDVIQPTKPENNSCVFIDKRTGLSVDLSPLKRQPNQQPYKVSVRQSKSTFELNVCGLANSLAAPQCSKSAVCYTSDQTQSQKSDNSVVNYGLLTSSSFFFDGIDLRLKYFNGSKCSAHSDSGRMSSEIIFKCNPEAHNSQPRLHSSHACIAVFEWETDLVCNLRLPKCSVVSDNKFYNLRQLSSLSHAWNTTDKEGNVYFINVCTKLPETIGCRDPNAAVCLCHHDSNHNLNCSQSLGDPSADELEVMPNGDLLLTYRNGFDQQCSQQMKSQTQITFKCGQTTGSPKFIEFIQNKCIYKLEWNSFIACPVNDQNDQLVLDNGFLHDKRIDAYIDIKPLLRTTFKVTERRQQNNITDDYVYVINLSKPELESNTECSNSAVCQTKEQFSRDIGTIGSIEYYLRGHELQFVLQSFGPQKCGKNANKNVTTIFRLQCSSYAGVGEPVFMYESNDCDYTFYWETGLVCPLQFIDKLKFDAIPKEVNEGIPAPNDSSTKSKSSHTSLWIGIVIIVFFVVTLSLVFIYRQKFRPSLMFRFRRLFGPETTNHTFHYHQLASHEKDRQPEVVFINRNSIAAQPSADVPYYSIYDESDVDLLT